MTRTEIALFTLAVAAAIGGALLGWPWVHWIGKPAATAILLAAVARRGQGRYGRAIAFGLAASLLGDVALMLPQDLFLPGLAAFFVAHLAYLRAFSLGIGPSRDLPVLACFAALVLIVIVLLWPGLPAAMRVPVIAYAAVLGAMAAQAVSRVRITRDPADGLAAFGAVLFTASDILLAVNRFLDPLPASALWVLGLYFAAQVLIAQSALRAPVALTARLR
ncbi:lysoplasmalogenase [Paracoccus sp. p4-l81]|uniref:lysoplasmalogenase n=1 Tax=Paracoccus sp. p4-l81 TaxID=3342806 RepID=UPI0035B6C0A4